LPATSSIERAIGIVLGKLEGIEAQLKRQDESRAGLHRRLDELVMRTTHLETDMLSIKNKVDAHEKVTVEVTTLRTKAEGAGTVGKWLLRAGIAIVTFVGWLVGAYTWFTGRPPP
jgi:hypothetical protein